MRNLFDLPEYIQNKIMPCPTTGCWLWGAGMIPNGYGALYVDGRNQGAHRVVYQMLVGEIKKGLQVDHLCRNRACVNPMHLEPVTCLENLARGNGTVGHGRRRTHCKNGHEITPGSMYVTKSGKKVCFACNATRQRKMWAENREHMLAKKRAYQKANKDKLKEQAIAQYYKHKDKNKIKNVARVKRWRAANPEKYRLMCQRRLEARKAAKRQSPENQ